MQHAPRFLKIVDDARSRIKETDVDAVKQKLDRGEKFVLVDVREESEFAKDHLPGAIHLGKGRDRARRRGAGSRFRLRRWSSTAAADSVPPWPPITCRKWATPTCSRWMAAFGRGGKKAFR